MDDEEDVRKLTEFLKAKKFLHDKSNIKLEDLTDSDLSDEEPSIALNDQELENLETNLGLNIDFNEYEPSNAFTKDERDVIDNCTDPELKELLVLNRQKNIQLTYFTKKISDLLNECKRNIALKVKQIEKLEKYKQTRQLCHIWHIAAPYFKDKDNFYCWPNEDIVRKMENKELFIYKLYTCENNKWSQAECERLVSAVKLNYKLNRKRALLKNEVKSQVKGVKQQNKEAILQAKEEENVVDQNDDDKEDENLVPPKNSDEHIEWEKISEKFMSKRYSAAECRNYWHIHGHPDINKKPWTAVENQKICKLVKKYKMQNWDKIAEELNTGRTGYSVCLHFMTDLNNDRTLKRFTAEEDEKLYKLMEKQNLSAIAWNEIAPHFPNRTRVQLFHRWTYYLTQNVRKEKFSQEEDILLMVLVDRFGKLFSKCAQYFPGRSATQLKSRYNTNLQSVIKKGSYEEYEDRIIWEHYNKSGTKKWASLVPVLGRCRAQIRQRYLLLSRFFEENPNGDLKDVVRKKHTSWKEGDAEYNFLRNVANVFLNRDIPSLEEIAVKIDELQQLCPVKKRRMQQINDTHSEIDMELTNYFSNYYKTKTSVKYVSGRAMAEVIEHVTDTLNSLDIQLNIPNDLEPYKVQLDAIDIKILDNLRDNQKEAKLLEERRIDHLQPPNLYTSVSFRSLLIKLQNHREHGTSQTVKNFDQHINNYLKTLPEHHRKSVTTKMHMFYKRFYSIFKWPAVLTIEQPSEKLWKSCAFDAETAKDTAKERRRVFAKKWQESRGKRKFKEPIAGPSIEPTKTHFTTPKPVVDEESEEEDDNLEEDVEKLEAFLRAKRCKLETMDLND